MKNKNLVISLVAVIIVVGFFFISGDKVGEYDGYVGTGPTMLPYFRKKHSIIIKYSKI